MAESENQDGRMNSLKFIKKELVFLTLLVAMVSLLSGWSGCIPKDRPTVLPPSALQATDTLQVNDVVTVIISNIPKPPDPHQERIREDGTITLPWWDSMRRREKHRARFKKS
jgi:hypothetical protein